MKILGIIPARYASTRFPGKPLVIINGKTMIQRVYEQAKKATSLTEVVIATDDERIYQHAKELNFNVVLTSANHQSGTDRCAEVLKNSTNKFHAVINIQGDEPYINPLQIEEICSCFADKKTEIATLIKKIDNESELFNTNKPKVVKTENNFALYFSRQTIPFLREFPQKEWLKKHTFYKHIGIYGFCADVLLKLTNLKVSKLEEMEGLEQLRWLENGYTIKVKETFFESISIDTPTDLKFIEKK